MPTVTVPPGTLGITFLKQYSSDRHWYAAMDPETVQMPLNLHVTDAMGIVVNAPADIAVPSVRIDQLPNASVSDMLGDSASWAWADHRLLHLEFMAPRVTVSTDNNDVTVTETSDHRLLLTFDLNARQSLQLKLPVDYTDSFFGSRELQLFHHRNSGTVPVTARVERTETHVIISWTAARASDALDGGEITFELRAAEPCFGAATELLVLTSGRFVFRSVTDIHPDDHIASDTMMPVRVVHVHRGQSYRMVHIPASGLWPGSPVRDVWVTERHVMRINGLLVQASDLVARFPNVTIMSCREPVPIVHFALERHGFIALGPGTSAESFAWNREQSRHRHVPPGLLVPVMMV